ncbi:MAG: aldose epimerase family protein [Sarcina sp.]
MNKICINKISKYKNSDLNEYILSNSFMEVKILNFGGIIKEINVSDKKGNKENVVLAYENIEDYFLNQSYYGAIIGRTAGRIAEGKVTIDNKEYLLNKNYVVSNCHGGNEGFDKKIWNVEVKEEKLSSSLILTYKSCDGEENYPGNLDVKVIYTLDYNNVFTIEYNAVSDTDTLVNMTNHSYFNLSGDYKTGIENHDLYINSDSILDIDKNCVVTGNITNTKNGPFDFNCMKKIGKDIDSNDNQIKLGAGYDHPFNLVGDKKIILYDQVSGRKLEVITDNSTVVVYSMNYPDGIIGLGKKELLKRYGICFECQNKPIGYNEVFKEESILKAGELYKRETKFKFLI